MTNGYVPVLVQNWLIVRLGFLFDNFQVYAKRLLLSLGLFHLSETKLLESP